MVTHAILDSGGGYGQRAAVWPGPWRVGKMLRGFKKLQLLSCTEPPSHHKFGFLNEVLRGIEHLKPTLSHLEINPSDRYRIGRQQLNLSDFTALRRLKLCLDHLIENPGGRLPPNLEVLELDEWNPVTIRWVVNGHDWDRILTEEPSLAQVCLLDLLEHGDVSKLREINRVEYTEYTIRDLAHPNPTLHAQPTIYHARHEPLKDVSRSAGVNFYYKAALVWLVT